MNKVLLAGKVSNLESKFVKNQCLIGARFVLTTDEDEDFECLALGKTAEKLIRAEDLKTLSVYGKLKNYKYKDINMTIHKNKYILIYNFSLGYTNYVDALYKERDEEECEIDRKEHEYLSSGHAPFSILADAYA